MRFTDLFRLLAILLIVSGVRPGGTVSAQQKATHLPTQAQTSASLLRLQSDGQIIFSQMTADGTYDIFTTSPDGAMITNLTNTPGITEKETACSVDGRTIAFVSDRDGSDDLYVMSVWGNEVRQLTDTDDYETSLMWLEDNESIIFNNSVGDYVLNALTGTIKEGWPDGLIFNGTYSADGARMAVVWDTDPDERNTKYELFVNDGDGPVQITDDDYKDFIPHWSPDGTRLVFSSYRNGDDPDLYVINADGSGLYALTDNDVRDGWPCWSPVPMAGTALATQATPGEPRQLTFEGAKNLFPQWSPDGRRIVYYSDVDGDREIFVMDADSGQQQQLTHNESQEYFPAWSPDGRRVIYSAFRSGQSDLFILEVSTGTRTPLTDTSANEFYPDWSPDGSRIAYVVSPSEDMAEIYVMDVVESPGSVVPAGEPRQLTFDHAKSLTPAWSPDGSQIAFYSDVDGDREIFVMNGDGGQRHQLTRNESQEYAASWSPDGTHLIYDARRSGQSDLFILEVSTGTSTPLTDTPVDELYPDWSPDGRRIVYTISSGDAAEIYVMTLADTATPDRPSLVDAQDTFPDDAAIEELVSRAPSPVDADQIVMAETTANRLPATMTYTFPSEEIAPGVMLDTTAQFDVFETGMMPSMTWTIRNESGTAQQVEYIAELPKSFAESASMIRFIPPPTEIIEDDPLVKWLVDVDQTSQVLIQAQSAQIVALGAAVQGGDAQSLVALKDAAANVLIDIDMRRRLNHCKRSIDMGYNPIDAALCTLNVMGNYPGNFFPSDCDMAFDDVAGSEWAPALQAACHGILERTSDHGQACDSVGVAQQDACRSSIRHVLLGQCLRSGQGIDQCRYDAAVQSGDQAACDRIQSVDLATTCNAYLSQDTNYCQFIANPAALEACCGMFSYDADLYAQCMGDDARPADAEPTQDSAGPDVIDGDPTGSGQSDEDTLTLDEVLGSEGASAGNSGSGDAENGEVKTGTYQICINQGEVSSCVQYSVAVQDDGSLFFRNLEDSTATTMLFVRLDERTYEFSWYAEAFERWLFYRLNVVSSDEFIISIRDTDTGAWSQLGVVTPIQ